MISRIVILHHIYLILHYVASTPLYHTMKQCILHQLVSCKEKVATLLNSRTINFSKKQKESIYDTDSTSNETDNTHQSNVIRVTGHEEENVH